MSRRRHKKGKLKYFLVSLYHNHHRIFLLLLSFFLYHHLISTVRILPLIPTVLLVFLPFVLFSLRRQMNEILTKKA